MSDESLPPTSTSLVPFLGAVAEGADAWVRMHRSDRRRLATEAARDKDVAVLLSLTEAWLRTYSTAGAIIATGTIDNHTHGVRTLLAAWTEEDLLKPDTEAANRYVRVMERQGLKPGTIYGRVAVAHALFRALRWTRASLYDPFADVHVPHDPTPPWEKRRPYTTMRSRRCSTTRLTRSTACSCCWARTAAAAPASACASHGAT